MAGGATIPTGGGIDGPLYADWGDPTDWWQSGASSTQARTKTEGSFLNHMPLRMVAETQTLFITQMTGQVFVYGSPPGNPLIAPLGQIRRSPVTVDRGPPEKEQERYDGYVKSLPTKLREKLRADSLLPPDKRNLVLEALNNCLRGWATTAVWADNYIASPLAVGPTPMLFEAEKRNVITAVQQSTQIAETIANHLRAELGRAKADSPGHLVFSNYLKILSDYITMAKHGMQDMQVAAARSEVRDAVALIAAAQIKLQKTLEAIEKAREQQEKQAQTKLIMQITGPLIAVAFLALAVATGGVGAILLATAMLAIAVADAADNNVVTGAVTNAFASMGPVGQALVATLLVCLIIAAPSIGAKLGIGVAEVGAEATVEAGAEVAAEEGTEAATAAAQSTGRGASMGAKLVSIQAAMTLATMSGMASGYAKMFAPNDEQTQMIIEASIQILTMIMLAIFTGGAAAAPLAGRLMLTRVGEVLMLVGDLVQAGTQIAQGINSIKLAQLEADQYEIKGAIERLESFITTTETDKKEIQAMMKKFGEELVQLGQLWSSIITSNTQSVNALARV